MHQGQKFYQRNTNCSKKKAILFKGIADRSQGVLLQSIVAYILITHIKYLLGIWSWTQVLILIKAEPSKKFLCSYFYLLFTFSTYVTAWLFKSSKSFKPVQAVFTFLHCLFFIYLLKTFQNILFPHRLFLLLVFVCIAVIS